MPYKPNKPNKHRLHKYRTRAVTYGSVALLAVAGLTITTALAVTSRTGTAPQPATVLPGATTRVTLVTGDTVGVTGGTRVVGVDRGKGRAKVPYSIQSFGGHTSSSPTTRPR
ncbi:hypothetical protein [Streptomyces sp. V4I8]|uniref:hypothetical protein n=1 Tax=Streptomyces sp. V4I8 TaxID=3156469 RepID=UPI003518BC40